MAFEVFFKGPNNATIVCIIKDNPTLQQIVNKFIDAQQFESEMLTVEDRNGNLFVIRPRAYNSVEAYSLEQPLKNLEHDDGSVGQINWVDPPPQLNVGQAVNATPTVAGRYR